MPLSPWMRMGTPDAAALSIFCRIDCMVGEWPKITLTGGKLLVLSPEMDLEFVLVVMVVWFAKARTDPLFIKCTQRTKLFHLLQTSMEA